MNGNAAPDLFLIALATLDLLGEAAGAAPLLVLADDAHWLDRSTSEVLTFVARRVSLEPIVILIAIRDGSDSPFESAGLAELRLDALEPAAASELLASHAPQLATDVRARLLNDAAGNPLALIELPAAFESRDWRGVTLPDHLPLSARLESAFAARSSELPSETRALLLVSAAGESVSLAEVLRAAALVVGTVVEPDALEPAISTRLIEVDKDRIRFSHPLVRPRRIRPTGADKAPPRRRVDAQTRAGRDRPAQLVSLVAPDAGSRWRRPLPFPIQTAGPWAPSELHGRWSAPTDTTYIRDIRRRRR